MTEGMPIQANQLRQICLLSVEEGSKGGEAKTTGIETTCQSHQHFTVISSKKRKSLSSKSDIFRVEYRVNFVTFLS